MAAPKYNEYWKERKKHGRDKLFSSEDEIIELAQKYIETCQNNPIIIQDFIKSGPQAGQIIELKRPRIPTILGFAVFLGIDRTTLYNYMSNESYKDFFDSLSHVCDSFQSELTDNALSGAANPMIAARILGLKEKTDITSNDKDIPAIGSIKLEISEAKSISESLDKDV